MWCLAVVPEPRGLRQEELEFQVRLDYVGRPLSQKEGESKFCNVGWRSGEPVECWTVEDILRSGQRCCYNQPCRITGEESPRQQHAAPAGWGGESTGEEGWGPSPIS